MWSLVRAEAGSQILDWIMMLSILLAHKITRHIYISILLAVALNPPQPGPEADLLCYLFVSQENVREKKLKKNWTPQDPSPSLSLSQFVAIPCNRTLTREG
jgi:hypothetical protein